MAMDHDQELQLLDAWWRAANYLAVGMIYLRENPLLAEPLRAEHIKARLLGHWAGLIQSVSQSLWPEPPAWGLLVVSPLPCARNRLCRN